jgi:E3 ubiquitin-protein ligase RNF14
MFTLPPEYPSASPPHYEMSCLWLPPAQLASLASHIDNLLQEYMGCPSISFVIDLIQNDLFSVLGIDLDLIEIKEMEMLVPCVDDRVSTDFTDIESCGRALVQYNMNVIRKDFFSNMHTCPICYSSFAGSEFCLLSCEHYFCLPCVRDYIVGKVEVADVLNIKCPHHGCTNELNPDFIRSRMSKEMIQKYEDFMLQKALEGMEDVVYCPSCSKPCIKDADNFAICDNGCHYSFCTSCLGPYHPGEPCLSPDIKKLLKLEANLEKGVPGDKKNMKELQEEAKRIRTNLMSEKTIQDMESKSLVKACPGCKAKIMRVSGCNKMTCTVCNVVFCNVCGKNISDGKCIYIYVSSSNYIYQGSDHFTSC